MSSSDIILRGGMIVAALLLVSTAASHLGRFTDETASRSLDEIAASLGNAIECLRHCDPGSTTFIFLGGGTADSGSGMTIPGRMRDERIILRVLPGSIFLEMGSERKEVSSSNDIIPMFPPAGGSALGFEDLSRASSSMIGFTLKAPSCLGVSTINTGKRISLFLYPHVQEDPVKEGTLSRLMDLANVDLIEIGSGFDVHFDHEDMMMYMGEGLFLWRGDGTLVEEGCCPVPFKSPTKVVVTSGENRTGTVTAMKVEIGTERTDAGLDVPVLWVDLAPD